MQRYKYKKERVACSIAKESNGWLREISLLFISLVIGCGFLISTSLIMEKKYQ